MRTGLTKQEKTTEIYFDEKDPTIFIRTHNTDLKNRLTAYNRLERPYRTSTRRCRTGVAVQPRHADGLPCPLIQSALEKVRQMQVGQQRRPRLNPAPEAGHGLRNA